MPRPLILLLAFSLLTANLYADTDRDVYDEADGIFKQAEEAVGTNLATFVQANEKPLAKAREEMAELIARMNKEGRSQLATSLQKRLNGLEETVQKRVRTEVPIVVPPEKPLLERMEGKWIAHDYPEYFMVNDGGAWIQVKNDGKGTVIESVAMQLLDYETAEVRYKSGWCLQCRLAGDDVLAVTEIRPDGRKSRGFALERGR